jgi:O-antigen/teichoic acid export membrane protein
VCCVQSSQLFVVSMTEDSLKSNSEETGSSIISGTRWTTFSQAASQVIRVGVSLGLARLLAPADFGLMAMALLVIGFVELFKDLGTVAAIVQVKALTPALLDSVFYLNLFVAACCSLAAFILAPLIAQFFSQPELTIIVRVLSLLFVISAASLVMRALMQRSLLFARFAAIELVSAVGYGFVALLLALHGLGVWCLVIATLASAFLQTFLFWSLSQWKPRFQFAVSEIRRILHFSANITGAQCFSYFIFQTDKILIGRFLGETALGFYSMAQRLLEMPITFITQPVSKVLFPAFSALQHDNMQIAALYSRAAGAIALCTFPLLACFAIVSSPFVGLILGPKWSPIVPLIQVLVIPTAIQTIAMTVGAIYMAKGKSNWLFLWQVVAGTSTVVAMFIGIRGGLSGLTWAYTAVIVVLTYPAFAVPFRLIGFPVPVFFRALLPCLVSTVIMLLTAVAAGILLDRAGATPLYSRLISAALGLFAYISAIYLWKPPAFFDFLEFFRAKAKANTLVRIRSCSA